MRKIGYLIFINILIMSITYPCISASDIGIDIEQQNVTINMTDNGFTVEENIKIKNSEVSNVTSIRFWIQQDVSDVEILAVDSGTVLSSIVIESNTWECNLNDLSINPEESLDIRLTYTLLTDTEYFVKNILYPTTSLSIIYEENELYHGELISESNSLRLLLHRPTETPINIIYIVIIFLLVVVVVAATLLLMRKQRTKAKKSIVESEETLMTKKALLLSILKDIEKKHRTKDLSDESYNKLKEEYKQQAVEVMKKLDDIKN
jgi:hypothetical protein